MGSLPIRQNKAVQPACSRLERRFFTFLRNQREQHTTRLPRRGRTAEKQCLLPKKSSGHAGAAGQSPFNLANVLRFKTNGGRGGSWTVCAGLIGWVDDLSRPMARRLSRLFSSTLMR